MNQNKKPDFEKKPRWVFITLIIILIGASPAFSDLILDFLPELNNYWQGILKLLFIVFGFLILFFVYWQSKKCVLDYGKANEFEYLDNIVKKSIKKTIFKTRMQTVFIEWPLNIITLKIIPLIICRIIRCFIKQKGGFLSVNVPKYWDQYNEIKKSFFRPMLRLYIDDNKTNYEMKFNRDFRKIQVRFSEKGDSKFKPTEQIDSYEKVFSGDLKPIKIFSWITPFGLYWNLIRITKAKLQKIVCFFKN